MSDFSHSGEWRESLKKSQSIGIAAGVLVIAAIALMVLLNSGFAYREAQNLIERRAGLELQAGNTRLTLIPFALQMTDVKLLTKDGSGRQIVSAPSAVVPMQWRSLLTRKLKPSEILVEKPVITITIDENGSTGWSGKGDPLDVAVAKNSVPGDPLKVAVRDGSLDVVDQRTNEGFGVKQITADFSFDRTGTMDVTGTAAVAEQFTQVEAHVASLPRLSEDGTPFDLLLKAPALEANFSGRLSVANALSLAGTFSATSANFAALVRWFGGSPVPQTLATSVSLSGPLDVSGKTFQSSDITLTADDMTFKGKLGVEFGAERPLVTGQLSTDKLKLAAGAILAPQASAPANAPPVDPQINLAALKTVDVDLTLSAFAANWGSLALGSTTIAVQGKGGRYDVSLAETSVFGGTGSATLHLDGSADMPQAGVKFDGKGIDLGQAFSRFGAGQWLTGTGDLSVDLTATGRTREEMISTLQGKASLAMLAGEIKGFDVASSIQQAASALVEGWVSRPDAATGLNNLTADFDVRDGIATASEASAVVAGVEVSLQGDVDFLRRAVDLRLSPDGGQGGVPVAIHVVGPWEKPKLKADLSDALGIPGAEVDGKDVQKAAKKAKKFLKKVIGN